MAQDFTTVIVGGGPAGMIAAIAAVSRGGRVALIEQMKRPGLKLLATGGGRCNLTNTLPRDEFMRRFGRDGRFMQTAVEALDSGALRAWLEDHGVPTAAPDGFHVYPVSEKASSVHEALLRQCAAGGVHILLNSTAKGLLIENGRVIGVVASGGPIRASRAIVATGGRSYPELGATGSGYELARQAGHTIAPPLPVLVRLVTAETWPAHCAGVSLPDVRARVALPGASRTGSRGGLLFTHTGVSGPAILDLSREAVPLLARNRTVPIRISLAGDRSAAEWMTVFDGWQRTQGRKSARNLVAAHIPHSLAAAVAEQAGIPEGATAAVLSRDQRQALAAALADLPLTVTGSGGFEEAIVTRGGVSLKEIDPRTMQSRRTPGLYFAGEVVDLDGPEGGFNLQWAFSSGWLAGLQEPAAAQVRTSPSG